MREAHVLLRFPEKQYVRDGRFLDMAGAGRGSSMTVAINRAIRSAFRSSTLMRYKVPKQIYISVGLDELGPIPFWHSQLQIEAERESSPTAKPQRARDHAGNPREDLPRRDP